MSCSRFGAVFALLLSACAQPASTIGGSPSTATSPVGTGGVPALDAIRSEDLRRDIFFLASDAMRGREAGTLDELRASVWLA